MHYSIVLQIIFSNSNYFLVSDKICIHKDFNLFAIFLKIKKERKKRMYEELLPIGSVVLLKDGEKRVMICGRIQAKEGEDTIYDYSACYYPEGILSSDSMIFFNRDAIQNIYFIGFQDEEGLLFQKNVLGKLGELEIRDGKIVEKE